MQCCRIHLQFLLLSLYSWVRLFCFVLTEILVDIYILTKYSYRNGVCDTSCDDSNCEYDSGDCNQLCDLEECDVTGWTDTICNSACNSTECDYDGYDCDSPLTCANTTLCNPLMLGDGWCDIGCKNDSICGWYENAYDCSEY